MPRNHHKNPDQKALEALKKHLRGGEVLIVGVSGGPDSVFLLRSLLEFKPKLNLVVAHINHSLRGPAAEEDTEFVKNLAKKNKLEFHSAKFNILSLAKQAKKSVEETGRDFRYNFLHKLYKKKKASFILTAHHADDNLETVLFNLIRGGSLQAFTGMQEVSSNKNGDKFLRPLLCLSKQEILDFLIKNHITYRIDDTNSDITIPRNFIRHTVIPELKTLNPNLAQTILKNSQIFLEIKEFLENEASIWIDKNNLSANKKNLNKFNAKTFAHLPPALQKEIILLIYKKKEGATKNIEKIHIEQVVELIKKNIGGKTKSLGKYKVEIKLGTFIMKPCQS